MYKFFIRKVNSIKNLNNFGLPKILSQFLKNQPEEIARRMVKQYLLLNFCTTSASNESFK